MREDLGAIGPTEGPRVTPSNLTQFLLILVFVVPGIVYQTVRARYLGEVPQNKELAAKVLRALAASTMLALGYVVVFSSRLAEVLAASPDEAATYAQEHAGRCAWWVFLLVFLVPAVLGRLVGWWPWVRFQLVGFAGWLARRSSIGWSEGLRGWGRGLEARTANPKGLLFDSTPTAWDWAVDHAAGGDGFVRVRDAEGQWWGGAFGKQSYFSTYPEEPAVFVETAWTLSETGEFMYKQPFTAGAWIPCKDVVTVQFMRTDDDRVDTPTPASTQDEVPASAHGDAPDDTSSA